MDVASRSWKRNLYALVIGESLVLVGFNFVGPFLPLFVQDIGALSDRDAAFWAGMSTGGAGLAAFVAGPIWGLISDRTGRKPMLLRSQFAGALVVALIGLAPNIPVLISLRTLQGMLSGTVPAAMALMASIVPREKMAFTMGVFMVAYYGSSVIGPAFGGPVAHALGFRNAFFITAGLLFAGGIIVLLFVKEHFVKPPPRERASFGTVWRLAASRDIFPLLLVQCALQAGTQVLAPVIPLIVKTMEPQGQAATASGIAFALMGVLAGISALGSARLEARFSLKSLLVFSCIGTAVLHLPPMLASNVPQLIVLVMLTGLLKGGLLSSSNAMVGLSVSAAQQGVAYGLAQSANALGGGLGPLLGGSLASWLGFKSVFPSTALLFVLVAVVVIRLLKQKPPAPVCR